MRMLNASNLFRSRAASTSIAAIALAGLLVAAGCESDPGRQRSNKARSTMSDTRAEFVAGRGDVEKALMNLAKLQAKPANLTPTFHDYSDSVTAVQRRAQIVQRRVQDMRLNADAYSQGWSNDTSQISDPNLRDLTAAQNESARARFAKVDADAQDVRAAYDPFVTQLNDLQVYLSNLLTASSIDQASPIFDATRTRGQELLAKIDSLVAELDATQARISPTTTPVK